MASFKNFTWFIHSTNDCYNTNPLLLYQLFLQNISSENEGNEADDLRTNFTVRCKCVLIKRLVILPINIPFKCFRFGLTNPHNTQNIFTKSGSYPTLFIKKSKRRYSHIRESSTDTRNVDVKMHSRMITMPRLFVWRSSNYIFPGQQPSLRFLWINLSSSLVYVDFNVLFWDKIRNPINLLPKLLQGCRVTKRI